MNHKWNNIPTMLKNQKEQKCANCGITRYWCLGDYQCWEYVWTTRHTNQDGNTGYSIHKTFKRPQCKSPSES